MIFYTSMKPGFLNSAWWSIRENRYDEAFEIKSTKNFKS